MTNARYHTFRLQNLFVSCPNIFIKQRYSIFFLVWPAVLIIYILSPSPFIFVSVLLLRHGKIAEREQNREFVHFWVLNPCILCWQVLFLLQFFFRQNNRVILPRLIQLLNAYLYCALKEEKKYSRYSEEMNTKRITYNGNLSSEISR